MTGSPVDCHQQDAQNAREERRLLLRRPVPFPNKSLSLRLLDDSESPFIAPIKANSASASCIDIPSSWTPLCEMASDCVFKLWKAAMILNTLQIRHSSTCTISSCVVLQHSASTTTHRCQPDLRTAPRPDFKGFNSPAATDLMVKGTSKF